jgi:hypothetical protein
LACRLNMIVKAYLIGKSPLVSYTVPRFAVKHPCEKACHIGSSTGIRRH